MRTSRLGLCALLAMGGVIAWHSALSAANWPRFRGPNGAGIANDTGIPIRWTEKEILWKIPIPGVGNSSPVIWGDRLFLQSAGEDGKERLLLCLSTKDGKMVWKRSMTGTSAETHRKNSLASSTPATDGERVYALFWDGNEIALHGFSIDGQPLWQRQLGGFTSQHGPGMSPIVVGDKVILPNDQDGSSVLLAFEAKTGKIVWQAARQAFRACYSTPMLLDKPAGAPELLVASTAGITSYDSATGSENWNWSWAFSSKMPLRTVASPVVSNGLVFANSGDGSGDRHTVAVRVGGKGDVSKTHLAWEVKRSFPYVPTMLAWDKHLYFVHDKGIAGCCVAETGASVWTERLRGEVTASPVLINGNIYVINEEGEVFVFPAAPEFKLLAKNSIGEPVFATPAVANNRLYVRGKSHLFCIGER